MKPEFLIVYTIAVLYYAFCLITIGRYVWWMCIVLRGEWSKDFRFALGYLTATMLVASGLLALTIWLSTLIFPQALRTLQ